MQKSQTSIDQYFKTRKRPAADDLPGHPSKISANRKLQFDCDTTVRNVPTDATQEETQKNGPPSTPPSSPATVNKLRKELNLGEYRRDIRNSKRSALLRKKIEQFASTQAKLKKTQQEIVELEKSVPQQSVSEVEETSNIDERVAPTLQQFDTFQIEVPSSPVKAGNLKPKRLFWTSPIRSPAKNLPYVSPRKLLDEGPNKTPVKASFEKYNHLIAADKEPLILPHKYLVLKEIFRSTDIITKVKADRGELITFKKLQKDVQRMLRRNFTEKHLAQILAVYPESYALKCERVKSAFTTEEKSELIVARSKTIGSADSNDVSTTSNSERLKKFHNFLLERTKVHHQKFLETLDPPIHLDSSKLKLWHPEFELDSVPDVEPALLPAPPVKKEVISAKAILEKTLNAINMNNRMNKAVASVASEMEKNSSEVSTQATAPNQTVPTVPKETTAFQKALQGIPKSLLEKIRAKQAAKMAKTLTQTTEEAKERIMLSRLPELAKILRNIFVSEKKGILPVETVLLKIGHSYREKLNTSEFMEHMQLITKHVPGWMNFCNVRNAAYIRLSKDADMTRVLGKLQKLANPTA